MMHFAGCGHRNHKVLSQRALLHSRVCELSCHGRSKQGRPGGLGTHTPCNLLGTPLLSCPQREEVEGQMPPKGHSWWSSRLGASDATRSGKKSH